MTQLGERRRLAQEAVDPARIERRTLRQHLERDLPPERRLPRHPDDAHAAATELALEHELAEHPRHRLLVGRRSPETDLRQHLDARPRASALRVVGQLGQQRLDVVRLPPHPQKCHALDDLPCT
jgi:hypothetical protein